MRNTNSSDRLQIIESFQPFAVPQSTQGMMIGNDLDSVISACFLNSKFGWDVTAIYDYKTLWYSASEKDFYAHCFQGHYAAIDLDIYHPNIFSVGHHILENDPADVLAGHARTLNPNLIRGINVSNFKRKYPLGTIHFLVWLFDENNLSRRAKFVMWLADSAFINAQSHRFRENALDWVKNYFKSDYLLNMTERVDLPGFEQALHREIFPMLEKSALVTNVGQVKSRHWHLSGHQGQWKNPNRENESIIELFHIISELTGWSAPKLPNQFHKIEGQRHKISLAEITRRFGALDHFLLAEKVFSYVFPFRDSVNYTNGIA